MYSLLFSCSSRDSKNSETTTNDLIFREEEGPFRRPSFKNRLNRIMSCIEQFETNSDSKEDRVEHTWSESLFYVWYPHYFKTKDKTDQDEIRKSGIKRIRFYKRGPDLLKILSPFSNNLDKSLGKIDITYTTLNDKGISKKRTFIINSDFHMRLYDIEHYLLGLQARPENIFRTFLRQKHPWENINKYYRDEVVMIYDTLHVFLQQRVCKEIKNLLQSSPTVKGINLIDMGCGEAYSFSETLLAKVKRRFPQVQFKILAYDSSQNSIDICLKHSKQSEIKYRVANSDQIRTVLAEEKHLLSGANTVNIAISSGSMTRAVLDDAFESIHILQECWLAGIDRLILTGLEDVLISSRIIKRVGFFTGKYISVLGFDNEKRPVYTLKPVAQDEMFKAIKTKLQKKPSVLDLSMNAMPIEVLQKLQREVPQCVASLTMIDLSYSRINFNDNDSLIAILANYPKNTKVICTASSVKEMTKFIQKFPLHLQLEIGAIGNEYHLMGSDHFLKRFDAKSEDIATEPNRLTDDANIFDSDVAFFIKKMHRYKNLNRHFVLLKQIMQFRSRHFTHPAFTNDIARNDACLLYIMDRLDELPGFYGEPIALNELIKTFILLAECLNHQTMMHELLHFLSLLNASELKLINDPTGTMLELKSNDHSVVADNGLKSQDHSIAVIDELKMQDYSIAAIIALLINTDNPLNKLNEVLLRKGTNLKSICAKYQEVLFAIPHSIKALELIDLFVQCEVDFLNARKAVGSRELTLLTYVLQAENVPCGIVPIVEKILTVFPELYNQAILFDILATREAIALINLVARHAPRKDFLLARNKQDTLFTYLFRAGIPCDRVGLSKKILAICPELWTERGREEALPLSLIPSLSDPVAMMRFFFEREPNLNLGVKDKGECIYYKLLNSAPLLNFFQQEKRFDLMISPLWETQSYFEKQFIALDEENAYFGWKTYSLNITRLISILNILLYTRTLSLTNPVFSYRKDTDDCQEVVLRNYLMQLLQNNLFSKKFTFAPNERDKYVEFFKLLSQIAKKYSFNEVLFFLKKRNILDHEEEKNNDGIFQPRINSSYDWECEPEQESSTSTGTRSCCF